jgi:L-2-hydroxyglutarate oxidase
MERINWAENAPADVTIVGAGIVGLATAWQLRQAHPGLRIRVLEQEAAPAQHQTGRNSGVIHSGIYYKPGSYKAELCRAGYADLLAFAKEEDIAHELCGKLIVASNESELPRLEALHSRAIENHLPKVRRLDPAEARELEPNVHCVAALHVPYTGIVDYGAVARRLVERLTQAGVQFVWNAKVGRLDRTQTGYQIAGRGGPWRSRWLIGCAGLQADRLAKADGVRTDVRIVPFRGDYFMLRPEARAKVRHLIYPVPNPDFPFLGVHLTRMVGGEVECGPNAVLAWGREGYSRTSFSPADAWANLNFGGLWRFGASHWRTGWYEYRRAFSRRLFLSSLQQLVPSLQDSDLLPGRSGIRAQAMLPSGQMVDDFAFADTASSVHVLCAPSPAATASFAIGREVVRQFAERVMG